MCRRALARSGVRAAAPEPPFGRSGFLDQGAEILAVIGRPLARVLAMGFADMDQEKNELDRSNYLAQESIETKHSGSVIAWAAELNASSNPPELAELKVRPKFARSSMKVTISFSFCEASMKQSQ